LKGLDYTDNAAWFAQETFADEVAMKSALKKGGSTSLNVYSTSGGGFLMDYSDDPVTTSSPRARERARSSSTCSGA
jgi:hypothetical protein